MFFFGFGDRTWGGPASNLLERRSGSARVALFLPPFERCAERLLSAVAHIVSRRILPGWNPFVQLGDCPTLPAVSAVQARRRVIIFRGSMGLGR